MFSRNLCVSIICSLVFYINTISCSKVMKTNHDQQERRTAGRDLQEEKTKRLLEERNREKEEEKAARERIKQQIAMVSSSSSLLSVYPNLTFIRKEMLVPNVPVQLNVHLLLMASALCSTSCFNLFNNEVLKHNKPNRLGTLCFVSCRTGWRERHAMPKIRRRRGLPNRHYCRPGRQNRRTEGRQL